ncbi:right-handed parallel beta-helix repeat-containing protein [Hymenobacter artigasi]|uniref:Repeat protein (TIGR01451 family) n=1 Tax=Hymenobacter artigasi TaxID=2719616 RepID=A0ABX1HN90_9BACT|nr:right-handed parallel beta-helix repeat-containing protein [Hymenobacter artigasi]NKI91711.1 putative repeat protein (TIGR01451 family) [Hymenobacter artigasi]
MTQFLRTLGLLLAFVALIRPGNVWAQACTTGTSTLVLRTTAPVPTGTYTSNSIEEDKHPTGTGATTPGPETVRATSFLFSDYLSTAPGALTTAQTTNDIFRLYAAGTYGTIDGRALVWRQNNSAVNLTTANGGIASGQVATTNANTPFYATVTLTFDREVSNLTFVVQDIDKGTLNTTGVTANGGGSDFTDELDLYALNGAGTRVALAAANVSTVANINQFLANQSVNGTTQDAVRGIGLNGDPNNANSSSRLGNVTITFTSPVKSVRLTFRNLNTITGATTRIQTIGFEQISWCSQADLTTTLAAQASPVLAGGTGQFNVTFANVGDITTAATTQRVQLPTNLSGVSATNGGVYSSTTGFVTYSNAAATALANYASAAFSSVITFTAPASGLVNGTSTITSTTTEGPSSDPNPNTATAAIAVTPVADLTTTLTGPGALVGGVQSGNYTVTYTNNGPSVAASTTRTVTIPTTYLTGAPTPSAGTVTTVGGNYVITFPAGTNVASGNTASYTFTITPTAATSLGQSIPVTSNTAPGTGGTGQGANTAPDQASINYVVGAVADVGVSFSSGQANNSTVTAGTTVTYGVTFTNAGPSAASDVTRTVSIPAGVLQSSIGFSGGTLTGTQTTGYTITYPGGVIAAGNSTAYAFSFAAPASGPISVVANTTTSTGQGANTVADSDTRTLNVTPVPLSGTVYDDVNYGGGAGRTYTAANNSATASGFASNDIGSANTIVEIYNNLGAFVGSTTTNTLGAYSYNLPGTGSYTVRVVNSTVVPVRTSTVTGLVPVQTYVLNDVNRVGGENPQFTDAAANTGSQTLSSLSSGTVTPQSLYTATFTTTATTGIDFGFNFDTVVNTNDVATVTGTNAQGSLRQFLLNARALSNTNLDQAAASTGGSAPAAGVETSIFMISNGTSVPGLRAGLMNQLTAGVAVITPVATLPQLTGANSPFTRIDGTTQTQNVGNTNNVTLGAGGTVGTAATALGQLNGPEVQLSGRTTIAFGLDIAASATNTTITGLAIVGFGNALDSNTGANIRSAANDITITRNILGSAATAFAAPATPTNADNVRLTGGTSGVVVSNNLIGYSNSKGIAINNTVSNATVSGNEIRSNGLSSANYDGVDIQGSSNTISNNLLTGTSGQGVDSYRSAGSNTITGNTITDNGRGTATVAPSETPGVRIYGANNTISQNIISDNYGAGIMLEGTTNAGVVVAASATKISQNSIFNNGTVLARNGAAATGQVGIDLEATGDNELAGTAPFQTLNSATATGANGLVNYPILTSATLVGTNLVLKGYAKAGASIELFLAQANTLAAPSATTGNNFGQGRTYLTTLLEGSAADTDARIGLSYSGPINGFDQGSDTNASGFIFTIALNAAQQALVVSGVKLTATSTLGNATSEFSGNISLSADVTTTITGPNDLAAGQPTGIFTATFSNPGNTAAATVTQKVTLPTGASLTAAQLSTIQTAYPTTTVSGGVITFPAVASLAAGASNVYQFAFTAATTTGAASIASNVTTTTTQNPNTAPDAASFALTVSAVADVAATVTGNATSVAVGSAGTFNVTFTNLAATGPNPAAGVVAAVQLPAGLNTGLTTGLVSASNGGVYDNTTGLVTYAGITSLTSGQSQASVITYTQPNTGTVTATATVSTTTNQVGQIANDVQAATNTGSAGFDLATTLSGPATAVAGTLVTYGVTTSNNGPGTAPGAVQTVSIPTTAALTDVFLSNGGTYSFSNSTSLFTFPVIPALSNGQQVNNSISFTSPGPASGSLALTALVTPNTSAAGDANTVNNQVSISTTLTTAPAAAGNTANLYVTISSDKPNGVAPGTPIVFTVTQANNGPNAATSVMTRAYLPTGLTGVVVKDKAGATITNSTTTGYNAATGVVIFPTETNEASANTPLSYTITANAPASGVVTATATVTAATNDPVPADNVALTAVTVNQPIAGDMATSLSGPATATPGESVVYTVTAVNNGTTNATGVSQTVQLPAGLTGVVVRDANNNVVANTTTTGYNAATGLVTYATTATLAAGASLTRTITLPAPDFSGSATGGSIVPVASVTSTSPDVTLANNTAKVTTVIKPVADFTVSLSGPATAVTGSPVTYTVTTANNGPSVGGQQTTVQLPIGLDAAGGGLVLPTGATYSGATGLLTLAAVPAQGLGLANARTSSVSFNLPAGLVVLTPTAQVTAATGTNDANLANNVATATTTVTPATELIIDLATTVTSNAPGNTAGAGGTQTAGQPITFTVTATNNTAGSTATNVVQQLALAAGLTGVKLDGTDPTSTTNGISTYATGTYNANTGVVTFNALSVVNGTPRVRTVLLNAPTSGPLVATAAVKGDQSDAVTANNTANTSIAITTSADLVTSTTGPTATAPSTPVTYSVITTNNGPSAAISVVPTIVLPAGATNVVLPAGANLSGSTVTFATIGSLANGQIATNTVTFTSPATAGSYTVNGNSQSTTTDPTPGNNASSAATTSTAPTPAPVAFDVVDKTTFSAGTAGAVNTAIGNTAGQVLISPLSAAASTGRTIATYLVTALPNATQGKLYYNSTGTTYVLVTLTQPLTPAQAASLKFAPADNATTSASVGDITFSYTATDDLNNVSNAALYTIPVGKDNNSFYTSTPNKGRAVQYQTNDVLAFVIDPNGAAYNSAGLVYNASGTTTTILATGGSNGLVNTPNSVVAASSGNGPAASGLYPANPTNVLPAGVSLDPATGLVFVSNRALLVNNNTVKYYQINVTTTDVNGGTNLVTAQFSIGGYPLPVELTDFTATAVKNLDAALLWHTAQEKNNDHFDVERSLNGTDFVKIGDVKGQGSKTTATEYALTDAGIGPKAKGLVYYRLKQVDTDGETSYSPVRTVAFTTALVPVITLFPNPATTGTQLDLTQLPTGRYQVSVLDATGRIVLNTTLEAGLAHALDLNTIASGTYNVLVRGQSNGQPINLTKRLIKE